MTRTELIIQLLKVAIGLAFGAYFVWWSLEVLDRLTPENEEPTPAVRAALMGGSARGGAAVAAWPLIRIHPDARDPAAAGRGLTQRAVTGPLSVFMSDTTLSHMS